ncbi:MAG: hypothetical protein II660_04655, partial [Bacteroidales bacterium]|nr:hypothetical protein [Bacteroidales bacterium]
MAAALASFVRETFTPPREDDSICAKGTEEPDAQILYDVNGGTWTDACPPYQHLSGDIYDLDTENLHNNQYEPTD